VSVILEKTEVPCYAKNVCVCVYTHTHTHTHNTLSTDRLFSDTSNWCIYPLFLTFCSIKPSQPLYPPSCPHTFTFSKPSQTYIHSPALTHLTAPNHRRHYIHNPTITQLFAPNHRNNYIHRPVLTHLTPANHHNHYIHCPTLADLSLSNHHNKSERQLSKEVKVTSVGSQGSLFGPLLCLVYINDIWRNIDSSIW